MGLKGWIFCQEVDYSDIIREMEHCSVRENLNYCIFLIKRFFITNLGFAFNTIKFNVSLIMDKNQKLPHN